MNSGDEAATQSSLDASEDPSHEGCKYSFRGSHTSATGQSKADKKTAAEPSTDSAATRPSTSAQPSSKGAIPKTGSKAKLPAATGPLPLGPPLLYTESKCERCGYCFQLAELTASSPAPPHACSSGAPLSPLRAAALLGDAAGVRAQLAAGADPNERCGHQRSVLHCAAVAGFGDVVGALLAAGADPSLPDDRGRTPLHSASNVGHVAVARQLMAAGAVVDAWPSRMLFKEDSERPREPSPAPADRARDEELAAALVVASLRDPGMDPEANAPPRVLARKWWIRTFNARRMQHWWRKRNPLN